MKRRVRRKAPWERSTHRTATMVMRVGGIAGPQTNVLVPIAAGEHIFDGGERLRQAGHLCLMPGEALLMKPLTLREGGQDGLIPGQTVLVQGMLVTEAPGKLAELVVEGELLRGEAFE